MVFIETLPQTEPCSIHGPKNEGIQEELGHARAEAQGDQRPACQQHRPLRRFLGEHCLALLERLPLAQSKIAPIATASKILFQLSHGPNTAQPKLHNSKAEKTAHAAN
jgi:hypothetical protein